MLYKKRRKYKYSLQDPVRVYTGIEIPEGKAIGNGWLTLNQDGILNILDGYAWDGATLCPDVKSIIYPSLVHDALYQLIREGILNLDTDRKTADITLRYLCIDEGMWRPAAWLVYFAVRIFGRKAAENDILHV